MDGGGPWFTGGPREGPHSWSAIIARARDRGEKRAEGKERGTGFLQSSLVTHKIAFTSTLSETWTDVLWRSLSSHSHCWCHFLSDLHAFSRSPSCSSSKWRVWTEVCLHLVFKTCSSYRDTHWTTSLFCYIDQMCAELKPFYTSYLRIYSALLFQDCRNIIWPTTTPWLCVMLLLVTSVEKFMLIMLSVTAVKHSK